MTEPKITIYLTDDGKAVIRYPSGIIPDQESVERVSQILNQAARDRRAK